MYSVYFLNAITSNSCLASYKMVKTGGTLTQFLTSSCLCERISMMTLPIQLRDSSGFSPVFPTRSFAASVFPYIILYHPCIQDIKVIFLIYNIIFIKNIHFYNITILHILQYIIKHNRFFYHLNAIFMIYSLIFLICG